MEKQFVCTACGFNMVGYYPEHCPFCGASREMFITSEECSERFQVGETAVNEKVTRLNSVPALGLEHAAFRIKTGRKTFWIDCPSCFDKKLVPVDVITFTHHHFLGASNQYRQFFNSRVRINELDSLNSISSTFTFDELFNENFTDNGIEAFHINGHTPGFTFYIFEGTLFICDYVFFKGGRMEFNPFGPEKKTKEGGSVLNRIIRERKIETVCGYNYVAGYDEWKEKFDLLIE